MRNYDLIVAYQEPYDSQLITSKHRFIKRMVEEGIQTLYIEIPLDLIRWLQRLIRKKVIEKRIGITTYTPLTILPTYKNTVFDNSLVAKIEAYIIYFQITMLFRRRIDKSTLFLVYIPKAGELANLLKTKRTIYHLIDDFCKLRRSPNCLKYFHKKLICEADSIITPSMLMKEELKSRPNLRYLPHGYIKYSKKELDDSFPNDLKSQKYAIYYGQTDKLNKQLVKEVLRECEWLKLVILGNYANWISDIPNIEYRGLVSHRETMAITKYSTVLWCPFEQNRLTSAMTPIKFVEATALGVPIVTTYLGSYDQDIYYNILSAKNSQQHARALRKVWYNGNKYNNRTLPSNIKGRTWHELELKFIQYVFNG